MIVEPAPREQPQVGRTSEVRTHKTRMNYWWDHCPRTVHEGIWDRINLRVNGPLRIEDVFVRPQLDESLQNAMISVSMRLSASQYTQSCLEVRLLQNGQVLAQSTGFMAVETGEATFRVEVPLKVAQVVVAERMRRPAALPGRCACLRRAGQPGAVLR